MPAQRKSPKETARDGSGPQQERRQEQQKCYLLQCSQMPLEYPQVRFVPPCWRYSTDFLLQFKSACVKNVYDIHLEDVATSPASEKQPETHSDTLPSDLASQGHSACDIQMAPINMVLEKESSQPTALQQSALYIPRVKFVDERKRRVSSGSLHSRQEFIEAPLLQRPVARPVSLKSPERGEDMHGGRRLAPASALRRPAELEKELEAASQPAPPIYPVSPTYPASSIYLAPQCLAGCVFVPAPKSAGPAPLSSDGPSLAETADAKPPPAAANSDGK